MLTFLDLLVVVFLGVAALGLLATCLMFLVRNPIILKTCFYIVAALGIYTASVGIRIGTFYFPMQTMIAILTGAMSITAIVLQLMNKNNEKMFLIARILAAAALVIGIVNAFIL